jgi:hypothetical protein
MTFACGVAPNTPLRTTNPRAVAQLLRPKENQFQNVFILLLFQYISCM